MVTLNTCGVSMSASEDSMEQKMLHAKSAVLPFRKCRMSFRLPFVLGVFLFKSYCRYFFFSSLKIIGYAPTQQNIVTA